MEPVAAQTHFICMILYKIDVSKDADALLLTLHLPTSYKIHRVTSLLLWAHDRIYKTQLIKLFTRFSSFLRLPQSPLLLISCSAKLAFVKNFELDFWRNGTWISLLEHSVRKNMSTFSDVPLLPEIYHRNDHKSLVSVTFRPDFPERFC